MQDLFYLQRKLLDHYVDRAKQRYLSKKEGFDSVIIAFNGKRAWVIPLLLESPAHKNQYMLTVAGAFAAKDVTRFAFFMDTWSVETRVTNADGKLTEDEIRAEADKLRAEYPKDMSAAPFPGREEYIIWGMYDEDGPKDVYCQQHDSSTHTMKGKAYAQTSFDGFELRIIRDLIPISKSADFARAGVSKKELWRLLKIYLEGKGVPVLELDVTR